MIVIKCDQCQQTLYENENVIISSISNCKIGVDAYINKETTSTKVSLGLHFCSVECLISNLKNNESIK